MIKPNASARVKVKVSNRVCLTIVMLNFSFVDP